MGKGLFLCVRKAYDRCSTEQGGGLGSNTEVSPPTYFCVEFFLLIITVNISGTQKGRLIFLMIALARVEICNLIN